MHDSVSRKTEPGTRLYKHQRRTIHYLHISSLLLFCSKMCSEDVTCIEPETCGQLVTGLEFHKFFLDTMPTYSSLQQSVHNPKVGDPIASHTSSTRDHSVVPKILQSLMSKQRMKTFEFCT